MSRTIIGKVGLTPKKDYDLSTSYKRLDLVSYKGSSYVCLKDCIGVLPTNDMYWQLSASKGDLPINGVDYNTPEEKEEFKEEVIADSKIEIDDYTTNKTLELETKTSELIGDLEHQKDLFIGEMEVEKNLFDTNASQKTTLFDKNAENKTSDFNTNASEKVSSFNTNAETLINTFNENSESKTSEFNDNAKTKTSDFNTNAEAKTTEYDDNATIKTTAFNNNATEKTNTFNSNAEAKTADFNTNASTKQTEYDDNATAKVNEFNENAESYATELTELAEQMPWNTTDISESIHVEDSAKYSRNKLIPFGNMMQKTREGYNLIDTSKIQTQTKNGVTINNNEDGSLTLNGTATVAFGINTEITQKTISAGSYTKYINKNTDIGTGLTVSLGTTTSGAISETMLQPKIGIGSLELTEDLTYNQLRLYINSETVFNNYVLKWMLVKGTYTEDTIPAYEPYGAMPSIDYPSMPVVATGVQTIKKIKKNCYDISKFNTDTNMKNFSGHWIYLKPNTAYTISTNIVTDANSLEPILGNPVNNNSYIVTTTDITATSLASSDGVGTLTHKTRTVVTGETGAIFIGNRDAVTSLKNMVVQGGYIQIEEGDIATPYEPYTEEVFELDLGTTELCKITDTNGNVVAQDRAVYRLQEDGTYKWQWEKQVGKVVLDGTEYYSKGSASNDTYSIFQVTSSEFKNLTNKVVGICDKLVLANNSTTLTKECFYYNVGSGYEIRISILNSRLSELSTTAFKKWLVDNNITIYYVAKESTYEECTAEQSEVLDKLYKLQLEKGTNNIIVESENGVTTELQLTYMQDRIMLEEAKDKEFDDRITALEAMIVSNASEEV